MDNVVDINTGESPVSDRMLGRMRANELLLEASTGTLEEVDQHISVLAAMAVSVLAAYGYNVTDASKPEQVKKYLEDLILDVRDEIAFFGENCIKAKDVIRD